MLFVPSTKYAIAIHPCWLNFKATRHNNNIVNSLSVVFFIYVSSRDLIKLLYLNNSRNVCAISHSILNGHATYFTMWMTIVNASLHKQQFDKLMTCWLWYCCYQDRVHQSRHYCIWPWIQVGAFSFYKLQIYIFGLNRISEVYHCYDCHKCKASHTMTLKFRSTGFIKVLSLFKF